MTEQRSEPKPSERQGMFIRGTFLGTQPSRTFTRAGTTEDVNVKPKIGLEVNGETVAVKAKDDQHMTSVSSGWTKGQTVTVEVEARPPYGARGEVDFVLPGVIESREQWR